MDARAHAPAIFYSKSRLFTPNGGPRRACGKDLRLADSSEFSRGVLTLHRTLFLQPGFFVEDGFGGGRRTGLIAGLDRDTARGMAVF
jgi:hypothetical protein